MFRSTRNPIVRRTAGLLLTLMHVLAVSAAAADAVLDAGSSGTPLHVESHDAKDGNAHHDHLFCQVLRSLGNASGAEMVGTAPEEGLQVPLGAEIGETGFIQSATLPGLAGPRGPPLV